MPPRLNVNSMHLISLFDVPLDTNWRIFKNAVNNKTGGLIFIETFEGWGVKQIDNVILEFKDDKTMMGFVNDLSDKKVFPKRVTYKIIGEGNRSRFFDEVIDRTGVDLKNCNGIPPPKLLTGVDVQKPQSRKVQGEPSDRRPLPLNTNSNMTEPAFQRSGRQQEQQHPVKRSNNIQRQNHFSSISSNGSNNKMMRANRFARVGGPSPFSQQHSLSNSEVRHVEKQPSTRFIVIKNVPADYSNDDIKGLAVQCGPVRSVKLKIFATIRYMDEAGASNAVAVLNNREIKGTFLEVEGDPQAEQQLVDDLIDLGIRGGTSSESSSNWGVRQSRSSVRVAPPSTARGVSPFQCPSQRTFPVLFKNIAENFSDYDILCLAEQVGEVHDAVSFVHAVVEFENEIDASNAVRSLNGRSVCNHILKVEHHYQQMDQKVDLNQAVHSVPASRDEGISSASPNSLASK